MKKSRMLSIRTTFFMIAAGMCLCSFVHGADDRQTTVTVNALDDHWTPIKGLRQEDFRAKSGRHQIQPVTFCFAEGPRRIVILLDTSGSMSGAKGSGRWNVAHDATLDFVNSVSPRTRLSLLTFAAGVEEKANFSTDRRGIIAWLSDSHAGERKFVNGRTALYEAIIAAIKQFGSPEPGDAILVVTDGGENASKARSSQVTDALRASGVRLFALLLPDELPIGTDGWDGREKLLGMVRDSGGFGVDLYAGYGTDTSASYSVHSLSGIRPPTLVYDDQARALVKSSANAVNLLISGFYMLTLKLPDNVTKPRGWSLELVDSRGHSRKDVTLTYPGHLLPAAAQTVQH